MKKTVELIQCDHCDRQAYAMKHCIVCGKDICDNHHIEIVTRSNNESRVLTRNYYCKSQMHGDDHTDKEIFEALSDVYDSIAKKIDNEETRWVDL